MLETFRSLTDEKHRKNKTPKMSTKTSGKI
jgi:hypothetical protein